jgi:RNA polymerase sigma factor (TIGR02999 family)
MTPITPILRKIEGGDAAASGELLTMVYAELRRLAKFRMRREGPGHTLQPTALVHEAFIRIVGTGTAGKYTDRGHFFAAAAEAMRRILIENARRKRSEKHGGKLYRCELSEADAVVEQYDPEELLDLDCALEKLAREDDALAKLVKLRYFAGLTVEETAEVLGIPSRSVKRNWAFARAWLSREMSRGRD